MTEFIKELIEKLFPSDLEKRTANLLSTFDKTVAGLEKVAIEAKSKAAAKNDEAEEACAIAVQKIEKARDERIRIELKAVEDEAEIIVEAEETRDVTVEVNLKLASNLTKIAEKNAKIAGKIKNLIS